MPENPRNARERGAESYVKRIATLPVKIPAKIAAITTATGIRIAKAVLLRMAKDETFEASTRINLDPKR